PTRVFPCFSSPRQPFPADAFWEEAVAPYPGAFSCLFTFWCKRIFGGDDMDFRPATPTLGVILTLMGRAAPYQRLTGPAGLVAGFLAGAGALAFLVLDAADPWHFGAVWSLVFLGSLLATTICTAVRARQQGEQVWSRQARAILLALAPSLFAALALSVFF